MLRIHFIRSLQIWSELYFAGIRALSSRDRFSILQEKVHLLGLKIPLNRRAVDKRAINRYFFYRINAAHSFHLVTPNLKRASFVLTCIQLFPTEIYSIKKSTDLRCFYQSDSAGIRTQGPYIKSVLLYQLSYGIGFWGCKDRWLFLLFQSKFYVFLLHVYVPMVKELYQFVLWNKIKSSWSEWWVLVKLL